MTAIWEKADSGWKTLVPAGFPDEKALHGLVEDAPELLPISGSTRLTIVGREVPIGSGFADLVAVEPDGRIVIIEVKLAKSSESRRAVVAQVLSYAAFLQGTGRESFEQDLAGAYLQAKGWPSLAEAVRASTQDAAFDAEALAAGIERSLVLGAFRLVLVLDDAPPELVRLVGYLELIGEHLVIDLITVTSYDVGGRRILVPQRVEPDRQFDKQPVPKSRQAAGYLAADSGAEFEKMIGSAHSLRAARAGLHRAGRGDHWRADGVGDQRRHGHTGAARDPHRGVQGSSEVGGWAAACAAPAGAATATQKGRTMSS